MLQVRATAQILPVAVPVHTQRLVAGNGVDQLNLIGFIIGGIEINGALTVPNFSSDRLALVDDFLHLLFDHTQIFGGERLGAIKIVVPAIIDDRADGDLGVRPDFLHGAGHDMGQVVADQLVGLFLVLEGVQANGAVSGDRPLQIPVLVVEGGRDGFLGQRF